MSITKTIEPYEFLIRWENGVIKGAHLAEKELIIENGEIISERFIPARAVDPFSITDRIDLAIVEQSKQLDDERLGRLTDTQMIQDQVAMLQSKLYDAEVHIQVLEMRLRDK